MNIVTRRWQRRHHLLITAGVALAASALAACGSVAAPPAAGLLVATGPPPTVQPSSQTVQPPNPAQPGKTTQPVRTTQPARPSPLQQAGPGWALAEYSTGQPGTVAKPVSLYLIDPAGGTHLVFRFPATKSPWQLIDWSGDKTRALFQDQADPTRMHELNLVTGRYTTFTMPPGPGHVVGYTRPAGQNILAITGQDYSLARYSLTGVLQKRLAKAQSPSAFAISAADGRTEVLGQTSGVALVSNTGGVIRQLTVPVTGANLCQPMRWWDSKTVVVYCDAGPNHADSVWLVPISGAAPKRLTAVTPSTDPSILGAINAWRLPSGTYVLGAEQAGTFIGKLSPTGTITRVPAGQNGFVVTVAGSRMLVERQPGTTGNSLLWLNPASGAIRPVLTPPASATGVVGLAVPYGRYAYEPSV